MVARGGVLERVRVLKNTAGSAVVRAVHGRSEVGSASSGWARVAVARGLGSCRPEREWRWDQTGRFLGVSTDGPRRSKGDRRKDPNVDHA
jgi:hypothetical protein